MNGFTYRLFEPESDYPALDDCLYSTFGKDFPFAGATLRHMDAHPDPRCKAMRWMIEDEAGATAGVCEYFQRPTTFHPQKYWLNFAIKPEFQGKGAGSAGYDVVVKSLAELNPISYSSWSREDRLEGIRFLTNRGFVETMRLSRSVLDLKSFDMTRCDSYRSELAENGMVIKPYTELEDDPDRDFKLYELESEYMRDIPFPEPMEPVTFEQWKTGFLGGPGLLKDALFIAIDSDGVYAGATVAVHVESPRRLQTMSTGVRRSHRKMGIATALKLKTVEYAKEHGYIEMATNNSEFNAPMLAVNAKIGYVHTPAVIFYEKKL